MVAQISLRPLETWILESVTEQRVCRDGESEVEGNNNL